VLLTSHYMADVEALCGGVIVIHHGSSCSTASWALVASFSSHKTVSVELAGPAPDLSGYGEVVSVRASAWCCATKADTPKLTARLLADLPSWTSSSRIRRSRGDRARVRRRVRAVSFLRDLYGTLLRVALAVELQYRASSVIWLLGVVVEPVIYLAVWSAAAQAQGGNIGGFTSSDFAAYYLVLTLVNQLTADWHMWEFQYRVQQGQFAFLLLRPVHPIHGDLAENFAHKLVMQVVLLPSLLVLALVFRPHAQLELWSLAAFVPALALLRAALRVRVDDRARLLLDHADHGREPDLLRGAVLPVGALRAARDPAGRAAGARGGAAPLDGCVPRRACARPTHSRPGRSRALRAAGLDRRELGRARHLLAARAAPLLGGRELAMSWLRLLWMFTALGFQNEAAYRANFWVQIFESALNIASALFAVRLVFARTDTLAGWHPPELVALLGVYFTVYGAIHVGIAPGVRRRTRLGNLTSRSPSPDRSRWCRCPGASGSSSTW
jgi:ABC-type uncharacterized transport system permease subunit